MTEGGVVSEWERLVQELIRACYTAPLSSFHRSWSCPPALEEEAVTVGVGWRGILHVLDSVAHFSLLIMHSYWGLRVSFCFCPCFIHTVIAQQYQLSSAATVPLRHISPARGVHMTLSSKTHPQSPCEQTPNPRRLLVQVSVVPEAVFGNPSTATAEQPVGIRDGGSGPTCEAMSVYN